MSYGYDDLGCFTELEIAAGVPSLVFGPGRRYLKDKVNAEQKLAAEGICNEKKLTAVKLIAGVEEKSTIKDRILKKIYLDEIDYLIKRYAKKEALPAEHVHIVQQRNCLEILVKGFFRKVCKLDLDTYLSEKIDIFIKEILANKEHKIVYDRVGLVQNFIHNQVDYAYGKNEHCKLPRAHIKNLLSAARLHLNICDIKYSESNLLITIIQKSQVASDSELENPAVVKLMNGKKYMSTWRVKHMLPLTYYSRERIRDKANEIKDLSLELPLDEYQRCIIHIYSRI
jgi:hypothetical protein